MKNLVVAYDKMRAIGKDGDLPWGRDLPDDLRHFRQLTMGRYVIMGRHTFESIGNEPLESRINIVVSRTLAPRLGMFVAQNLHEALAIGQENSTIIGGASLYKTALPYINEIHATEVDASFDGADTFFPELDEAWIEVERVHYEKDEKNAYGFDFVTYRRD